MSYDLINVYTDAVVEEVSGYIVNFR
ncbi:MAG: hypothetical protein H6Q48_4251, partial [Deltaproteobacteria bacterium]|nr:hypothetical protein [Deltaproteobacteria bacterium]